jgi:DNA-binding NtrC family response regulator
MTKTAPSRIVIIDDDSQHLAYLTTLLMRAGYHAVGFTSAQDALADIRTHSADLVITDLFMPDMDGFELLRAIRGLFPAMPVVTLSGDGLMERDFYLKCSTHLGAVASLTKPFEPEELRGLVARLVSRAPG